MLIEFLEEMFRWFEAKWKGKEFHAPSFHVPSVRTMSQLMDLKYDIQAQMQLLEKERDRMKSSVGPVRCELLRVEGKLAAFEAVLERLNIITRRK
jgi:hypothetical protein